MQISGARGKNVKSDAVKIAVFVRSSAVDAFAFDSFR